MKFIKKFTAGFFLIIGLFILLLGTIDLMDESKSKDDKDGALAAIVIFGLPSTGIATWLIWGLSQENQHKLQQLSVEKDRLFLQLLQQEQGQITVTKFALYANISIAESQAYLDQKAKQLNANFEATEEGGIIYKFPE